MANNAASISPRFATASNSDEFVTFLNSRSVSSPATESGAPNANAAALICRHTNEKFECIEIQSDSILIGFVFCLLFSGFVFVFFVQMSSPISTHSADLSKLLETPLVDLSARRKSDRTDATSSSTASSASSSAKRPATSTPLSSACAAASADSEHKRRLTFSTLSNDQPLELPSMKKKQPLLPAPADEPDEDDFLNSPKNGHFEQDEPDSPVAQVAVKSVDSGKKSNQQQRVVKQPIGPPRLATAARSRPTPTPAATAAAAPPRSSFAAAALRKPSANQTVSAMSAGRRDRSATAVKPPIPAVATKRPRPTTAPVTTIVPKPPVPVAAKREPLPKENRLVRSNATAHVAATAPIKTPVVELPPVVEVDAPPPADTDAVGVAVTETTEAVVESTPKRARRAIDTPMKRLFDQAQALAVAAKPTTPPMELKVNRVMTFDL